MGAFIDYFGGGGGKKEGQYVWKKVEVETVEVTNPSMTLTGQLNTGLTITSNEIADFSLVDESFFDGFAYDSTIFFSYTEAKGLVYTSGGKEYGATWDATACKITIPTYASTGKFTGTTFTYTGSKVVSIKKRDNVTISLTQINTGSNPVTFQCASDDIDLSTIDVSYFYGYSGIANALTITNTLNFAIDEKGFTYNNNGKYLTVTYDAENAQLKFGDAFSYMYAFPDYVKSVETEASYVVAGDENAYPNGGMLDGHWYERFVGIIPVINKAEDTVTEYITYGGTTRRIAHGLGRKPDYFGIISLKANSGDLKENSITADATNINLYLNQNNGAERQYTYKWFAITIDY